MLGLFMALLSFRGIDTPSLPAQGEQRRSFYFNIDRDNSVQMGCSARRRCSIQKHKVPPSISQA
jgi:hypothetical protein